MITLVTVGTGTVSPSATRSSAAHWVEMPGAGSREPDLEGARQVRPTTPGIRLLMDCGAGTVHGLARCGLPWRDATDIALTHFHADHFGELPAYLFAMKYGAIEPRSAPLTLWGPVGTGAKLQALAAAFGDWVTDPGFSVNVREITPGDEPASLAAGVSISACKTPHTDESVAYSVATSAHRLVYTGDTGPSDTLADWAAGCDLLLAECSLPDAMDMPMHLTPRSVGRLAGRARAKRLVLTHLYPPVETVDIASIVRQYYDGPVAIARDGDRFLIGER